MSKVTPDSAGDVEKRVSRLESYVYIVITVSVILGASVAGVGKWMLDKADQLDQKIRRAEELATRIPTTITGELEKQLPPLSDKTINEKVGDLRARLAALERAGKCYESDWKSVQPGHYYEIEHNLRATPTKAWIWSSAGRAGSKIVLLDSIYADGGYGSWLVDVGPKTAALSVGSTSPAAMYGHVDQWKYWDDGKFAFPPSSQRFLKVVLCL